MKSYDNPARTDIVFSTEVEDFEAAARTLLRVTSWMDWRFNAAKTLAMEDIRERAKVQHLCMSYSEVRPTVKQTAQESHSRNEKAISQQTVSSHSLKETQVGKSKQMSKRARPALATRWAEAARASWRFRLRASRCVGGSRQARLGQTRNRLTRMSRWGRLCRVATQSDEVGWTGRAGEVGWTGRAGEVGWPGQAGKAGWPERSPMAGWVGEAAWVERAGEAGWSLLCNWWQAKLEEEEGGLEWPAGDWERWSLGD